MKFILNILFITIFTLTSHAQESDHEVGVWQFRTVDESDVENFLYNEDNVYRKLSAEAIKGGKLVHWALLRKVNGYLLKNLQVSIHLYKQLMVVIGVALIPLN